MLGVKLLYYLFQQLLQQTNAVGGGQDSEKGRTTRRYVVAYIGSRSAWLVQAHRCHHENTKILTHP